MLILKHTVTLASVAPLFQGYYNNLPITRSDGFVVQTGDPDPEGDVHDFFPSGSSEVQALF